MGPEWTTILAVAGVVVFAYGAIYPRLEPKTIWRIMKWDLILTLGLLVGVGYAVGGFSTRFNLILFETNWIVFVLIVMLAIEWPLFTRFCNRYDLNPFETDDD